MTAATRTRRNTLRTATRTTKALGYRTLSGLIAAAVENGQLILITSFLNRIGGADLPDGKVAWLGRHCAKAYRAQHGTSPIRVWAQHRTTGKWNHVYAYGPIDEALYAGLHSYRGTRHLLTTEVGQTNLHTELAETRAWITELHTDMNHPTYPNRAWEHRHNLEGRLSYLTAHETSLLNRIHAEEEATDRLVRAALTSGDPAVFAVAYVIAGTTLARAGFHTGTLAA